MAGDTALRLLIDIQARDTASGVFRMLGGVVAGLGKSLVLIGSSISQMFVGGVASGMAGFGQGLKDLAVSALKLIAVLALIAVAVGVALGIAAVKATGDFQQGLNRLVTGAGDVTDNMAKLGQGILSVSVATGILTSGTQGLNAAMYLIISAGQRGAQALDTLSVAAKGAVIEQANVVDVANVVSGVMTNYSTKTYNATQFMNGLITAVQQGKITLQQLAVSMGPLDPIARNLGISFNDVAAAMTTQTNAMVPAARAATGLRFMMLALENPTKKAMAAMAALGLNSVAVGNELKKSLPGALMMIYNAALKAGPQGSVAFNRAFQDMVGGLRSFTAATALTGSHMAAFIRNSNLIKAAMLANKNAVIGWQLAQGNFNVKMDQAKAAFGALLIVIGQKLLPIFTNIVSAITPVIVAITNWIVSGKAATDITRAWHAVIDPFVTAFQNVKAAIGHVVDVLKGAWAGAVATFQTALKDAKAALKGVEDAVSSVMNWFNQWKALILSVAGAITLFFLPALIQAGVKAVIAGGQIVTSFVSSLIATGTQAVIGAAKITVSFIATLIKTGVQAAMTGVAMMVKLIPAIIATVVQAVIAAAVAIPAMIAGLIAWAVAGWAAAAAMIAATWPILLIIAVIALLVVGIILLVTHWKQVTAWLQSVWQGFTTWLMRSLNAIGSFFKWLWNTVITWLVGVWNGLKNTAVSVWHNILTAISTAIQTGKQWIVDKFNAIIKWITDTWNGIIKTALSWGSGIINAIWTGIKNAWAAVAQWFMDRLNWLKGLFPHSPVEHGPLMGHENWGKNFVHGLAGGMLAGLPRLYSAANAVAFAMRSPLLGMGSIGASYRLSGSVAWSSSQAYPTGGHIIINQITVLPPSIKLDGAEVVERIGRRQATELRRMGPVKNG